jgi:hypothetical protein
MAKIWDESMRILVRKSPQAFVDLVIPQARFVRECSSQLRRKKGGGACSSAKRSELK